MEQNMESKKSMRDGSVAESGGGHVVQPFSASEQLYARSCARCAGLLVSEWYYDLHNTGEHHVKSLRCVQCGYCIDSVFLQNQIRPPTERQPERLARPRHFTRAGMLSKLA